MILYLTSSQCNDCRSGVTWHYLLSSNIRRAAAFCTRCNLCRWQLGTPYNRLFLLHACLGKNDWMTGEEQKKEEERNGKMHEKFKPIRQSLRKTRWEMGPYFSILSHSKLQFLILELFVILLTTILFDSSSNF